MSLSETAWSRLFLVKGVYNVVVSLVLLIWAKDLLPLFGAPAGNPAYPQMFLLLCVAFGLGYCCVGLDVDANPGIVVMGIIGQCSVFAVVTIHWMNGVVYNPALVSGVIDVVFAIAFALFLWTHVYKPHRAG